LATACSPVTTALVDVKSQSTRNPIKFFSHGLSVPILMTDTFDPIAADPNERFANKPSFFIVSGNVRRRDDAARIEIPIRLDRLAVFGKNFDKV